MPTVHFYEQYDLSSQEAEPVAAEETDADQEQTPAFAIVTQPVETTPAV